MCEKERFQYIYCLFCRSGTELRLSEAIERRHTHIRALAAIQEKHRYIDRRYEIDRQAFLPGYLFLYSKEEVEFESIQRIGDVYRFLSDSEGISELQGSDRAFAEWLWMNDGIVGISRISLENGDLRIHSGPMQHFAKDIVRLDKHTKNALVRMRFLDEEGDMWLAFEFDD
jgi:hypothetical protein